MSKNKKGNAKIEEEKLPPSNSKEKFVLPTKGSGTFIFLDSSRYEGDWEEVHGARVRHGRGRYTAGPEEYYGSWELDKMTGNGKYTFSSGAVYEGTFKNGSFEGEGIYTFPDGAVYNGSWKDGKMHGKGEYVDAEKVQWKGDFFNGMFDSGRTYVSLRPGTSI